jgi:hypothetical protein
MAGAHWVGTWTAAPAPAEGAAFMNHTLRMMPRVSLGGRTLRVRISNACGTRPLAVGGAYVGLRGAGPAVVPGSNRRLTFGGEPTATIAAGALLVSDPVELECAPLADLGVSVYLPGDLPASFGITGRYARQTNYVSPPGDFAGEEVMPVGRLTDDWYFVSGVDVLAPEDTGAVVALGDSLTDANISTHDGHHSWPSQLARRLVARPRGRPMAVMNQGLGGNRILHDIRGESGLRRFDRDVLAQPGVTHAIIMLGTNDLRNRPGKPEEEVSAAQMIAGLKQLAVRGQARGIKRSPISTAPCAIPTIRRGCCRSTTAATICIRATSATARWATRSISRSFLDRGGPPRPPSRLPPRKRLRRQSRRSNRRGAMPQEWRR